MERQLKLFFNFLEEEKKASQNTLQSYKRDLKQFKSYLEACELHYNRVKEEDIRDYIKELQENKDNRLILVSATLDCIASVVAKKLKIVDVLSTSLCYEKSYCLGKIREDLLGNKLKILKKHRIMPLYDVMITNDYSDIDVIFQSRKSYVVVENNIKRWQYLLNKGSYMNYIFIR